MGSSRILLGIYHILEVAQSISMQIRMGIMGHRLLTHHLIFLSWLRSTLLTRDGTKKYSILNPNSERLRHFLVFLFPAILN